jgi:putative DNA primase/helicase
VLDSREHFAAMRDSEELYQYDPETGIYRPNGDQYVGETLVYRLGRHHTTHEKREILDKLTSANWADRGDFGGSEGTPKVCVANGVLNIETGELTAHSPDERFVRRVNAAWPDDPDAATCPQFDALVRDVVGDDDARVIYNFLGLAVHPGYLKRSILLLHGEGGNGKTTLFDAIEQFLGPENVSNHTAHKLAGGKYATADLYGKMANVSDETPGRTVRHTETLKALSGDGTVEARRPYEGHFSFTNEAVLMFAANDPPEFDDDTVSIHQRLVPITCTNTFDGSRTKHEIVTDATTAAERSGVLVRAVEAARRLRNGGSVHRRTAAEARARYEKQSNTVAAFADAALEPDAVGWETNDDLYDAYVAYCEREDLPTKPRTSFFMTFEDAVSNVHDAGVEKTRRRVDGDRARGRAGVVFTSDGWRLLDSTRSTQSHLD